MELKAIIGELLAAGWTQARIAEKAGCSQPTISEIASGTTENPRFRIAAALIDLHRKECGRRRRTQREAA